MFLRVDSLVNKARLKRPVLVEVAWYRWLFHIQKVFCLYWIILDMLLLFLEKKIWIVIMKISTAPPCGVSTRVKYGSDIKIPIVGCTNFAKNNYFRTSMSLLFSFSLKTYRISVQGRFWQKMNNRAVLNKRAGWDFAQNTKKECRVKTGKFIHNNPDYIYIYTLNV